MVDHNGPSYQLRNVWSRTGRDTTLCFPGVLANQTQFAPLSDVLPGHVMAVCNSGPRYRLDDLVTFASEQIDTLTFGDKRRVNLVGASMGGMQIPFIIRQMKAQRRKIGKIVLVDAPTGVETMKDVPAKFAGLVSSPIGWPIMSALNVMGPYMTPSDADIDMPSDLARRRVANPSLTEEYWRSHVKEAAKAGMSGYTGRLYHDWVKWMLRVGKDGSLQRAAASLRDLDVTYIACTSSRNTTVLQLQAARWWEKYAGVKVVEVDAIHCGFLLQQRRFEEPFREIFS